MSIAIVRSRALTVASAPEVTVEAHLANGLPSFSVVGLPDPEVRESRERVRAALQNCHFEFPLRRITVNLAPAALPKNLVISTSRLRLAFWRPVDNCHWIRCTQENSRANYRSPARCARFAAHSQWLAAWPVSSNTVLIQIRIRPRRNCICR